MRPWQAAACVLLPWAVMATRSWSLPNSELARLDNAARVDAWRASGAPRLLQSLTPDAGNGPNPFLPPQERNPIFSPSHRFPFSEAPKKPRSRVRNFEGVIDTVKAHFQPIGCRTVFSAEEPARLLAVKNAAGRDVRRFVYDEVTGNLKEVVMPWGSYRLEKGGEWRLRNRAVGKTNISVLDLDADEFGNLHFADARYGAQVLLTVDDYLILTFWHRRDWMLAAIASGRVEVSADGLVSRIVANDGQRVLREFAYDENGLIRVTNVDGTSWHTEDGGKTWVWTDMDKTTTRRERAVRVDSAGNVFYTSEQCSVVEFADGRIMISVYPEWAGKWIE
jgi:hypothetical protein